MEIIPVKTDPIIKSGSLNSFLDKYITDLSDFNIVVIASKVLGILEGRTIPIDENTDKSALIKNESEYWIEDSKLFSKYKILLTIKHNALVASAGIDESNGFGNYVLWPDHPDETADKIWTYLRNFRKFKKLGVIITDSRTTPLRWGVTAFALSWSGFEPLYSYVNKTDIFGRQFKHEQTNIIDSLATAAAYVMGEGNETCPIAIIKNAPRIKFLNRLLTPNERQKLNIKLDDDIYAPFLKSVKWQKGGY